jgi:hypothetical protein
MTNGNEPLIKLEPGGRATILSYNVPEPTSYSGRNFIELDFGDGYLKSDAAEATPSASAAPPSRAVLLGSAGMSSPTAMSFADSTATVVAAMRAGFSDTNLFAGVGPAPGLLKLVDAADGTRHIVSAEPLSERLCSLDPTEVAAMLQMGYKIDIYRSLYGTLDYRFITDPSLPRPGRVVYEFGPPPRGGISIESPSDGAVISGRASGATVRVEGTADSEAGAIHYGLKSLSAVEVQLGSTPFQPVRFGPGTPPGSDSWSFSATVSVAGPLDVIARATYGSGPNAPVYTDQLTVTVNLQPPGAADTTPPELTVVSPSEGQTVTGPTLTVTGTAADPGSGVQGVVCVVDGKSARAVAATPRAPGDWSSWSASLAIGYPGRHRIAVRAANGAGAISERAVVVTVEVPRRRLMLVEICRLSSYLGSYGAGRVVKTFSLLPGEKSKISVKTFTKTETETKNASSILDSLTDSSSHDFEAAVGREQSDKQAYDETSQYKVDASADAGWGWGSAKVSASTAGSTHSAREEFSKNVSNATEKHSASASAKRDVQVNTSYEVRTEATEETSIEREISNINLSRTLNFVFRQMNQEFFTILHLVDVRIGYFDPALDQDRRYREVTLPQIDSLLADVIVPSAFGYVKNRILGELATILDWEGTVHSDFVEENAVRQSSYYRVKPRYQSTFSDAVTGFSVDVPGVILAVDTHVMRTEGLIVEALLGEAPALDSYATSLQQLEVRRREAEVAEAAAVAERAALVNRISQDNDSSRAQILASLTCPCGPEPPTLNVNVRSATTGPTP